MYKVNDQYFQTDSDSAAIYQYASYLTMVEERPNLYKIIEGEEVLLCNAIKTKKLRKQINRNDRICKVLLKRIMTNEG